MAFVRNFEILKCSESPTQNLKIQKLLLLLISLVLLLQAHFALFMVYALPFIYRTL